MKRLKVWQLVVLLIIVVGGSVLFVGLAAGWFSGNKGVVLDAEYICGDECDGEFMALSIEGYNDLIENKKSFIIFVDQGGCRTADKLRGYVLDWASAAGVKVYKMMFSDVKETPLYEFVRFYPSVAVISQGEVAGWLRADSDEDAEVYNNYDEYVKWIDGILAGK